MNKVLQSENKVFYLQCAKCEKRYDSSVLQTYATCCNQPLVTVIHPAGNSKFIINTADNSMWRYKAVLPIDPSADIVTLCEGWTKILPMRKLAEAAGIKSVLLKDESTNPTGSFKARGLSMAITKAKELGVTKCVIPTAGNAGGAMAAYCAKAGMEATVIMPRKTAESLKEECRLYGAELILVDGLIDSCGKMARQIAAERGHFDFSTLKEPYRLEGKKTIGYEIAEQLNWQLPHVILYPTGGGTGLLGMWKAFKEMREMGWITGPLPRMVIVQSENCAPMLQRFKNGAVSADFKPLPSAAYGLAVPNPFGAAMMMQVLHESKGTVITVSEKEMENGIATMAITEGYLPSPEGSATYVAMMKLLRAGLIQEDETVIIFNTGSWFKYR